MCRNTKRPEDQEAPEDPKARIYFVFENAYDFQEGTQKSLPIIRLTKSIDGTTGTATFLFFFPLQFEEGSVLGLFPLLKLVLFFENEKCETKNLSLIFKQGELLLFKAIFLFTTEKEWNFFLCFISTYAKQMDCIFLKTIK